ncbi:CheR family methyltransferase [Fibrella forsythiae]|uniref:histidine kinase n=1 Tax=Fibrella forsythiae TaxID=2817061 RepID=A0ABS3JNV6_9BACT|nr:CheR family methyltransferase [Fibrella forsythiae]MBO0951682.1 PAS domain S-box protein [Fibrella forsythiae]
MPTDTPSANSTVPADHTPIVAIGGPAGGQEAITELLGLLPTTTGFAYVYIQHFDPHHESQLIDILSKATTMPVKKAGNLMAIEPNHVYLIPPNQEMEVMDGKLLLMPRKQVVHTPIDRFFVSLSERQQAGGIAILLSGMATDGTLGLKAVKAAGGITIAQDDSALFQAMPKAAIAEGVVDLTLSPRDMASELTRLSQRTDVFRLTTDAADANEDDPLKTDPDDDAPETDELNNDQDLQAIIQYMRKAVGVDFSQYKITTIRRRIIRRMLLYQLDTLAEYNLYLQQHLAEASVLYNDLLINVTAFFRDTDAMSYMGKVVLPELIRNMPPREPLRIWIPACSTGQEAYSLAIMLLEIIGDDTHNPPIHIFATDLSEPAINKARQGIYTKSEVLDVSPKRLQRFFTKLDDQYRIHKSIRDLCVFAPHNLFKDPPFSRLDLISCRNLLIYLDNGLQRKAFSIFHYALKPNGFLLLGKSETVSAAPTLFTAVEKNYRVYNRRNEGSNAPFGRTAIDRSSDRISAYRLQSEQIDDMEKKGYAPKSGGNDLNKVVDNLLLNHYVPASVVVDQDLEILQFRGSTGLFLEPAPGKASLNLLKMARSPLAFELRNAVHKAQKSGQAVRKDGLTLTVNDKPYQIAIEAVPLSGEGEARLFLVLFTEKQVVLTPDTGGEGLRNARVRQLEDELTLLREDMHSIIEEKEASNEELQSANEEIVSNNEELQSINEELETSKEEIESTNEELLTINQELQVRNDQLTEAYGYAEAIFDTISEATIVLDRNLSVKSANKAFYNIFQVRQIDTEGKLLYELGNRQWDIPQLRILLESVILQNANIHSYEVTHTFPEIGQKVMRLNARKVVQHQRQEAILLAIEDITDHRRAQKLLEERQAWFRELMDNAPTLVWVSTVDATFSFVNRAWLDFTGCRADTIIGQSMATNIHPDDYDNFLSIYATHFLRRLPFSTEIRMQRQDGEYRWMQTNARPQYSPDGTFVGFIGTSLEVHLQKLNQELDLRVQQRTRQWAEANAKLEQTNRELQQTADRLQSVINGIPASITMLDVIRNSEGEAIDFSTSVFNESALTLAGQTAGDIINRTLLETSPEAKDNGLFDRYLSVLSSGKPAYEERDLGWPDPGYYAFYITRQIDANGLVVTVLNITDRKNAEAQVRQTVDSLQAVLDSSTASIGLLKARRDEQNNVVDFTLSACNQRFAELAGNSSASLVGTSVSDLSDMFWLGDTLDTILQVLATGETLYEEHHDTRNGNDSWLALSLSKNDDGVVVTGLDITSLKQAEQQKVSWLKEMERSDEILQSLEDMREHIRQRGEFLRATTHDLRGSFGVIEGAASLLNQMDNEEERAEMLSMLQRNLRQVTQMLTQLLDYSRLEAGQEQFHEGTFDASSALQELIVGLQPMATEKNLFLHGNGPSMLEVKGDVVKFSRIAQNLTLNALKYTQTGGVDVIWEQHEQGTTWQLTIRDTGPGLPTELIAMLTAEDGTKPDYERATNGQLTHTSANAGEGIGLLIVKRLCDLLGGRISVESGPETGTKIQLTLPRRYGAMP